jgi:hypothetical protein
MTFELVEKGLSSVYFQDLRRWFKMLNVKLSPLLGSFSFSKHIFFIPSQEISRIPAQFCHIGPHHDAYVVVDVLCQLSFCY